MFVYLRHGDNQQFLVNTNCPIILLLQHIKAKLELAETELVDLCDDSGALKLLFLSQQPQECARQQLPPRCSFTICAVHREWMEDGAFVSISPLLADPEPALLEALQAQTVSLEKARLRQLRPQEDLRGPAGKAQRAKGRGHALQPDPSAEESPRKTGSRKRRT
ncbi:uncharacterized protein CXorf65 homolog [Megalops cyprinoides]|uniref:uncharacterized protein CXorf65 homolog n=1 Tax=Megalops cyprinoides TaxID=118141 RepID=UPI0018648D82|nr:uncharacterized protein CXorf65 homolog [Megalops cyprinoides]